MAEIASQKDQDSTFFLDDQPSKVDLLDFNSYVYSLKGLIINPGTQTPLTVGVFGRWGTGKTTLMQMLQAELEEEKSLTIWFDAWQYRHENELWAAFLQSILNKLNRELPFGKRFVYKMKLLFKRFEWDVIPAALLKYIVRALIAIIPLLLVNPLSAESQISERLIELGGYLATGILAVWIVIKPLIETIQANVSIDFGTLRKESGYKNHIAFLDKFREHFQDIIQSLPDSGDLRLAIFIDDLDRCSPPQMLEVLDAVKAFIDISGCVYILGLDSDVVQAAVASKIKDQTVQEEYLGKIIQLPFLLPLLTNDEISRLIDRLDVNFPDKRCKQVFVTGLTSNPREIKRTINIFLLLWDLASRRKELVDKITPVRLAKVVVIQHAYHGLYKLLQEHPYMLASFELACDIRDKIVQAEVDIDFGAPSELIERTELDLTYEYQQLEASGISPEAEEFSKRERLRQMMLLYSKEDERDQKENKDSIFYDIDPQTFAPYFTLTSRTRSLEIEVTDKVEVRDHKSAYLEGKN